MEMESAFEGGIHIVRWQVVRVRVMVMRMGKVKALEVMPKGRSMMQRK